MLREECRAGTKVVFGRPNGEKTVGEVVEVHETTAEVRALETRGDGNRGSEEHRTKKRPAGTVWRVGFDIIKPLDERLLEALRTLPPKDENLLDYLERGSETLWAGGGKEPHFGTHGWKYIGSKEQDAILQAISSNYEHIRSLCHKIVVREGSSWTQEGLDDLNKRLAILFKALGRPVSEAVCRAWENDRRNRKAKSFDEPQRQAVVAITKEFKGATDRMHAWSVLGSLLGGNVGLSVKRLASLMNNKNEHTATLVSNPLAFGDKEETAGLVLSAGADETSVALPGGEVGMIQNEDPANGEDKKFADFFTSECQARGIAPSPLLADRASRDFLMWKAGVTENHWKTLVRSTLDNHARARTSRQLCTNRKLD